MLYRDNSTQLGMASYNPPIVNPSTEDAGGLNSTAGLASKLMDVDGKATGETYYDIIGESQETGYSPTLAGVNDTLYAEEKERMIDELPAILTDDNIDDEFKQKAYNAIALDERDEDTLSYQFGRDLTEIPEEGEGQEYLDWKNTVSASLRDFDNYNQAVQAAQDQSKVGENQSFAAHATDFIQLAIPYVEQGMVAQLQHALGTGDAATIGESFLLMGEAKQEFIDMFRKMPLEERTKAVGAFVNAIDAANTNLGMTNRLSGAAMMDALLYGEYEDWERYLDNIVSLLDVSVIGKPLAYGGNALKNVAKAKFVKSEVRPTSANRVANATNATEARTQLRDIIDDTTEETAQALTGTNRTEAVVDNVMPEPAISGSGLREKVGRPLAEVEKAEIKDPRLKDVVDNSSISVFSQHEVEAATAKRVNNIKKATGITSHENKFQVQATETGARIKGTYGPDEGAWTDAQDAIDLVAISLRDQGIAKEDLKILKKNKNGEYIELDNIPTEKGDYLVSMDYDYDVTYADLTGNWEKYGASKWNLLDRNSFFASKNFSRHLFDPATLLNKDQFLNATYHVDQGARATKVMLDSAKDFSDRVQALNVGEQSGVLTYIKEANEKGMPFRRSQLKNDYGMTDGQIDAVESFRKFWDDAWAVENRNEANAMRQEGYYVLSSTADDTRIFGRPVKQHNLDNNRKLFDPTTDDLPSMRDVDIDKLYAEGGQIIQMRKPMEFDGVVTDYVIVRGNDDFRQVRNSDIVYPYREGYYRVSYDAPHFITREVVMGDKKYYKAIATADTLEDARLYEKRLRADNPDVRIKVHSDKLDQNGLRGFERDMFETYGRGSQKVRGQRLEDATAIVRNVEQTNIKGPVDAMVDASRSLGNRIAMTDYLNASKRRFMKEFKDLLPTDDKGIPRFPATMSELGKASDARSGDARTQFEYLSYLEQGYLNAMDEAWKATFRQAAEIVGGSDFGRLPEKFLRGVGKVNPTQAAKAAGFWTYIGLNPARAFLMNAHQSTLLVANFGRYAFTPTGLAADFTAFTHLAVSKGKGPLLKYLAKASNRSEDELRLMYSEFIKSGLPDSIDFNNMVRGSLTQFAEDSRIGNKAGFRHLGSAMSTVRQAGFDAGEWVTLSTAWLAHYDKVRATKSALNKNDLARVAAEARNYTMNMGRAGDMPYNQNTLSLVMQFFQVPHKALLNMTTNQVLTKKEKARLFTYSSLAFGLPAAGVYQHFGEILPDRDENPELHDMLVVGLEGYLFNWAISGLTGRDTRIDWTPLSASDPSGIFEFLGNLRDTEVGEILANSPSGSLFMGDNARVKQLAHTAARWWNWVDDDPMYPTDVKDVALAVGHLSSGFSNAYRAKMAWETNKKLSTRNVTTDDSASGPEAIAQLFGFQTMDEVAARVANEKMYNNSKQVVDDAKKAYKILTTQLARKGLTPEDYEWNMQVNSYMHMAFKDSPKALEAIDFEIEKDISRGNGYIFEAVLKQREWMTNDEWRAFVKTIPDNEQNTRQRLLELDEVLQQGNE